LSLIKLGSHQTVVAVVAAVSLYVEAAVAAAAAVVVDSVQTVLLVKAVFASLIETSLVKMTCQMIETNVTFLASLSMSLASLVTFCVALLLKMA
jgi:hypothetical protein